MSLQIVSKREIGPPKGFDEEPYWNVSLIVDDVYETRFSAPITLKTDVEIQTYLEKRYEDIKRSALGVLRLRLKEALPEMWRDVKQLKTVRVAKK